MAKKDHIDLIKEFKEEQRDNDYIVLTTYCFDPFFFDTYLLNKIKYNNPNAEIIVLIDAEQYEKSYENFTDLSGKNYHLIPIYVNKGVFHPKMFLFLSKLNKKLTSYIGSGNLTIPGLTKNAELISKTVYNLDKQYSDINQLLEFLYGLKNNFIFEKKVVETLENVIDYLSLFSEGEVVNSRFKILNNLNKGIIPQLIEELKDDDFEELVLLAPFLSSRPAIIAELHKELTFKKVTLILPKDNHNLGNIDSYIKFTSDNSIEFEIKEGKFKADSSRKFHSKILYLKGLKDYLLIGSPNLTISALLETADKGNIEFSILYKDIDADEILSNVTANLIKNLDSISCSIKPSFQKHSLLKIYSADYNRDTGYLSIETEKIKDNAVLNIKIDGGKDINESFKLNDGKIKIKIVEGIPKEFEIECCDKRSKRRIFNDRGYFFRNLPRFNNISVNEINSKISSDYSISSQELLTVLIGLANGFVVKEKIENNSHERSTVSRESRIRREMPSHVRDLLSYSVRSLTENFNFQFIKKSLDENLYEYHQSKDISNEYNIYERLNRKITPKKIINDIKKVNELITYISDNHSDNNEQLIIQSCFIQLFLRFSRENVTLEVLEYLRDVLEDNIKIIKKDQFSEDSSVSFFKDLLSINYLYKYKESYHFASEIFNYNYILKKENYFEIKKYIKGLIETQFDEREFSDIEFNEYYSELVIYIFDRDSISDSLKYILTNLKNGNEEFNMVLYNLAQKLAHGSNGYPPRFSVGDEFTQFIDELNLKEKM